MQLGRVLTEQAFGLAKQRGVTKMVARMTTDQKAAITVFTRMGFKKHGFQEGSRPQAPRPGPAGLPARPADDGLDVNEFQAKVDLLWVQASGEVPGL